jgi:hypothetical protein
MFTWICPQCGREVPPSENACPDCAQRSDVKPPHDPLDTVLPAQAAASSSKRPPRAAPGPGLPVWLLALLFALGFTALGAAGFFAYRHFSSANKVQRSAPRPGSIPSASASPVASAEAPGAALSSLLLENLEVTGLRLVEDKQKKLEIRFLLVNHSPAPLTDIAATVTLRPSTAKPGKEVVGTFAFRLPGLEPYESRDMLAPVEAKMRLYELPDWQFLRADVVITSPLLRR